VRRGPVRKRPSLYFDAFSPRDGGGALIMRGVEFAATALVLLFGVGSLFGYIAAERVTCF
jgi:hypothetical protein